MEWFTYNGIITWAAFGALTVKLLELAELHKIPKIDRPDLKDWLYWIPYLILPILGAGLACVYTSSKTPLTPMLAFNIGVSAPLILRTLAQINPWEPPAIKTDPRA